MKDRGDDKEGSTHRLKDNFESVMHTQYVSVTGFLAGIAFTSMILLIEFSDRFLFAEWLITGTAIIGVLFIFASLSRIQFVDPEEKTSEAFIYLNLFFTAGGLFGLIAIIPLMLWSLTPIGAIITAVISGISTILYFRWIA